MEMLFKQPQGILNPSFLWIASNEDIFNVLSKINGQMHLQNVVEWIKISKYFKSALLQSRHT